MPNWCHSTLTVTGEEGALKAFVEAVETEEQPLSFSTIVPQPEDEQDWYSWRCDNWGTKWDACFSNDGPMWAIGADTMNVELSKATQGRTLTPTVAIYKFDTAWSPPLPFVEAASEQHPELEFVLRFGEPGEGYAGETKYISGLPISDEPLELEDVLAPEEMWY